MKIWVSISLLLFCTSLHAITVSRAKVEIRENKKVAQLSLFLQISDFEHLSSGKNYEIELVKQMKKALYKVIKSKRKLKHHKRFTHIFVTALENEGTERVAALISKTPRDRVPVISFFPNNEDIINNDYFTEKVSLTVAEQIKSRDS